MALLGGCRLDAGDWSTVRQGIRQRFPDVATISTAELAAQLQNDRAPVLLDARSLEEYAVSHLPGALHAPDGAAALTALADVGRDTPVVTYCSVGYRSAQRAEELHRAGFSRVRNLEGSIFQWANEDRPLVDADGPVHVVHPYGSPWDGLLDEEHRWQPDPAPH